MKYIETEEYIKAIKSASSSKVYIVGAGKCGDIIGKYFDKYNIDWEGYVDKRSNLNCLNKKPINTYENKKEGYFVVSSYIWRKELEEELNNYGVNSDRIIIYENQEIFYDIYEKLISWKVHTMKLEKFYNKHVGKRCFIVGNGPSLRIQDLEKIKKEITFASNSIYALYKHSDWRPTYYCAYDPIFCKVMMSEKRKMQMLLDGCEAGFTSILGEGIQYKDDVDMKNLYFMRIIGDKNNPAFSEECSKGISGGGTITYGMLQLAVYMGIKQIYLMGMDFNFSLEKHFDNTITRRNVCNHMNEIEAEEKQFYQAVSARYGESYVADIDLQLANFQTAKQYADSHDIEIYNVTRGGKLEVFPRIDFDKLFT